MRMTQVKSSNITAIGWEEGEVKGEGTLSVLFNSGGLYRYYGVEERVFGELLQAKSVGRTFHRIVQGVYAFDQESTERQTHAKQN